MMKSRQKCLGLFDIANWNSNLKFGFVVYMFEQFNFNLKSNNISRIHLKGRI